MKHMYAYKNFKVVSYYCKKMFWWHKWIPKSTFTDLELRNVLNKGRVVGFEEKGSSLKVDLHALSCLRKSSSNRSCNISAPSVTMSVKCFYPKQNSNTLKYSYTRKREILKCILETSFIKLSVQDTPLPSPILSGVWGETDKIVAEKPW